MSRMPAGLRERYLDLLQLSLTGELDQDPSLPIFGWSGFDAQARDAGRDWPATAATMIGGRRLRNLRQLAEAVMADGVPGDFLEAGVWRGGACILLRAVLEAHGDAGRKVWLADSFEGLPAPEAPEDAGSQLHLHAELAVGLAEVRANFQRYGLLDDQVLFLPGWFKDSLPQAPIQSLALLRLDGDLYASTMDTLQALYPKVSPGGAVVVDDYHAFEGCRLAVRDYLAAHGLSPRIEEIDGTGVYWRKPAAPPSAPPAPAPGPGAERHRYDYELDPASDSAAAHVLRMAGASRRVLELGAGPGSVTLHLSAAGCRVTAVERDPSALALLAGRCERAVPADLEAPDWEGTPGLEGPFDTVVLADVLEHLLDPAALLRRLPPLLAAGGAVVVSLPHVCYAPLLAGLMQEDFRYGPWGLLDRTHLRFFGLRNMQRLFEDAGYAITEAELVRVAPEQSEFAAVWGRLRAAQREALRDGPYWDVYQVVLKARPAADWPGPGLSLVALAAPPVAPAQVAGLAGLPTLVAFHLPQFHPFEENDRWWGQGFTEWTNVTKAQPLFSGHHQPQLPTDLGFYDLRLPQAMRAQAKLAEAHGIGAFCYHYYWFDGRRLMVEPLLNLLRDPEQRLPFCLCWANESWTRRWDGADDEILVGQDYPPGWEGRFFDDLLPFLRDPRYLRLDGLPLLVVYRPQQIPDAPAVFEAWRRLAAEAGLGGLHVCAALIHGNWDCRPFGADSGVEFPPHNSGGLPPAPAPAWLRPFSGRLFEHADLAEMYLERRYPGQRVFRTVVPSWDNSARLDGRAYVLANGSPGNYEQWLRRAMELSAREQPGPEKLLFINAWNEWAEGCHLEPDRRHGRAFLEATLRASLGQSRAGGFERGLALPEPAPGGATGWGAAPERLWRWAADRPRLKAWLLGHPRLLAPLRRLRDAWH